MTWYVPDATAIPETVLKVRQTPGEAFLSPSDLDICQEGRGERALARRVCLTTQRRNAIPPYGHRVERRVAAQTNK